MQNHHQPNPSTRYSQQGFKAYGAPEAIPTYDNCPNDIGPYDNSYCAKVRCYTATYDNILLGPPSPQPPQPRLACLRLRVELELWVLSQALLDLKGRPKQGLEYAVRSSVRHSTKLKAKKSKGCSLLPRPDIITPGCIMKVLRVSRREAYLPLPAPQSYLCYRTPSVPPPLHLHGYHSSTE